VRSPTVYAWRLPRNDRLIARVAASAAIVAGVVSLPFAHELFGTVTPGRRGWKALLGIAIVTRRAARIAPASEERPTYSPPRWLGRLDSQIVSGTRSIAPDGHSATQMPQPLQKS
jgi:hypothetical protein